MRVLGSTMRGQRAAVDGVVAADRHHHRVGAQVLRDDHPDQVAAEEATPCRAGFQHPGSAAGRCRRRSRRPHRTRRACAAAIDRLLDRGELGGVDVLRVDRHERRRCARPGRPPRRASRGLSTSRSRPDRGVLVDQQPQPAQGPGRKEIAVPAHVGLARPSRSFGRQRRGAGLEHPLRVEQRLRRTAGRRCAGATCSTRCSIGASSCLSSSPAGAVGLVAVPVERDMAAGDHDAARARSSA